MSCNRTRMLESLQSVTTIPKGSTQETAEARDACIGDDIVCSVQEYTANIRLIFGGTEFAYASDPEFTETSDDPKFWKEVIDRTYSKYYGLSDWHNELVYIAMKTGLLTIPSGREYSFHPYTDKWNKLRWPRTNILNYPVQGFAADIMQLIRIHIYDVLEADKPEILFVNTIHDDIQFDIHPKHLDKVAKVVYNVYSKMQDIIQSTYKFDFKVPLEVEVFYGPNLGDMTLYAN